MPFTTASATTEAELLPTMQPRCPGDAHSGRKPLSRAAVRLDLIAFVQEVIQNIEEATESEPDLEMLRNRPGLVGYIAKAGDDLWTIAKENHTTIQNIMETNHRKSEVLLAGEKVLIVKQVG